MRSSWLSVVLLVAILLGCVGRPPAFGQIGADRPGFADGAVTMEDATLQAELGYAMQQNGSRAHEIGQVLLRGGLTDRIELRGRMGSFRVTDGDAGYEGAAVGTKIGVFETRSANVGLLSMTALPVGTTAGALDRVRQELIVAFTGAFPGGVVMSVNAGSRFFYSTGARNDRSSDGLFIPTLAFGLSESIGAFLGYAGFYGQAENRNWVEGGVTILTSADTQIDVNGGVRVDGNADSPVFVGVGIARRF